MIEKSLLMVLLGCRPPGRNTEQHDVFFGIGENLKELVPAIKKSWPETKGNIHIDAWRKVTNVDGYSVTVTPIYDNDDRNKEQTNELFFINLGGYKENEFDEFHYKLLTVANDIEEAKMKAKKSTFYKHYSVNKTPATPNATAHIDDKFGIDVDEAYKLADILPVEFREKYRVSLSGHSGDNTTDTLHLGYFRLSDL